MRDTIIRLSVDTVHSVSFCYVSIINAVITPEANVPNYIGVNAAFLFRMYAFKSRMTFLSVSIWAYFLSREFNLCCTVVWLDIRCILILSQSLSK